MRNEAGFALGGCPLLGGGDCLFRETGMAVFQSRGRNVKVRIKRTEFALSEMRFVLGTLICGDANRFA